MPVRYFYHEVRGDAPPRNRAIAESRGSWLAFVDDDELMARDWLRQLYRVAQETGALVVGGAVHLHLPEDVLDRLGRYVRRTSFRETDYFPSVHRFEGKRLPGCATVLVARHVFEKVGSFDTSMAWGGSDSDFFLRVRAAGVAQYYTPHAVIRHRIPLNRLTPECLCRDAQQGCLALADLQYRYKGRAMLVLLCLARLAQALLVLLPGLAWARIRGKAGEVLDYQVRLWRSVGYLRKALSLLSPRWFAQERYFSGLKFCKGRIAGQQAATAETAS